MSIFKPNQYDSLANGQCVKMINTSDFQENGSHEVSIDITDLIDGVYFIRMSSSTETHTVKFVKQ